MAERNNAISEIVRFYFETCKSCMTCESIPVKTNKNYSDIDLVAIPSDLNICELPNGIKFERAIIETKNELDYDKYGTDFAKRIIYDYSIVKNNNYAPSVSSVNFSMLSREHYEYASNILFKNKKFIRIFIVHKINIDKDNVQECINNFKNIDVYFIQISDIINDLFKWYYNCQNKTIIRNSLVGDLIHLLNYCNIINYN